MRKQKGFSLIELLIVVAIILIIAAIAIPNLLRARMAANESSAAALHPYHQHSAGQLHHCLSDRGYGATLAALGGVSPCTASSASACLIDNNLATATVTPGKSGFIYLMTGLPATYVGSAVPTTLNSTGTKSFCSVEDAVVRVDTAGGAGVKVYATCQGTAGIAN